MVPSAEVLKPGRVTECVDEVGRPNSLTREMLRKIPSVRNGFSVVSVFAQTALAALHGGGHEIALVLTQPDRPAA
jgi:hypothetical protein